MLDGAGRLQLPGEQRARAGIGRRARVELVEGGILIRPSEDERAEAQAAGSSGGEVAYESLYNIEPPAATNGVAGNGKRGWWPRRVKRDGS